MVSCVLQLAASGVLISSTTHSGRETDDTNSQSGLYQLYYVENEISTQKCHIFGR